MTTKNNGNPFREDEIIKYDENLAVVRAITTTMKGNFPGLEMASVERDHCTAPAILELAQTRAHARSSRLPDSV